MDWDWIAPMIVMVVAILTTGGVIVLRPVSKRLGDLLDVMIKERRGSDSAPEIAQVRDLLGNIDARLSLLEQRQEFSEALLANRDEQSLPAASGSSFADS